MVSIIDNSITMERALLCNNLVSSSSKGDDKLSNYFNCCDTLNCVCLPCSLTYIGRDFMVVCSSNYVIDIRKLNWCKHLHKYLSTCYR